MPVSDQPNFVTDLHPNANVAFYQDETGILDRTQWDRRWLVCAIPGAEVNGTLSNAVHSNIRAKAKRLDYEFYAIERFSREGNLLANKDACYVHVLP